MAALINLSAKH